MVHSPVLSGFYTFSEEQGRFYPISPLPVPAGFPSPADDHREGTLNLHELLIDHAAATVFTWVSGNSMKDAHILDGDLLVIDRNKQAKDGDVVMVYIDGEFTVKFYRKIMGKPALFPANEAFDPIYPNDEQQWTLFGVVTSVIHDMSGRFAYHRKGG